MTPDPLDRSEFQRLMLSMGIWNSAWSTATRSDRARLYGVHDRRFLTLTSAARRRLRAWLDAQRGRPIVVEPHVDRCERIAAALHFYGDVEVLPVTVETIARLPRPVVDHVLDTCSIVVTGRTSNAWTSGPLPRLWPIHLAGHRTDPEIAATLRHEIGHRFLLEQEAEPFTARELVAERKQLQDRFTLDGDHVGAARFVRHLSAPHELQANALMVAWGAMAS